MEPVTPVKPNRRQRRQTLKTTRTVKEAAKDSVAVRRARKLAETIPLQNLNTDGSASSAAEPETSDAPEWRMPDVPPADFAPAEVPTGRKLRDTEEIVQGLCMVYGLAAVPMMQVDPYDGAILMQNAEASATSLEQMSRRHKRMRKVLKVIAAGNIYVTVGMVHVGMAVAIAAHHGLISKQLNEPFKLTWTPEKDPSWAQSLADQNGLSSGSRSTLGGPSATSPNSSNGSSPTGSSSPPSARPAPTPAEYEAAMRQAAAMMPGLHNLPSAMASYDPTDGQLRPEQDPAFLPELARRDR